MTKPTPKRRFRFSLATLLLVVTVLCVWLGWWSYRARQRYIGIEAVGETASPALDSVTTLVVSDDGEFLYSSAWRAGTVGVFRIGDGTLEQVQVVRHPSLDGAVDLKLSPDNSLVAVAAMFSGSALLFERDSQTGMLTLGQGNAHDLGRIADLTFSADGRFLYVAGSGGAGTAQAPLGGIFVMEIVGDNELKLVQNIGGDELHGVRGVTVHPNGRTLYATCATSGTLVVLDRDPESGRLEIGQVIRDEQGGVHSLAGVINSKVSADGNFVYTVSGRFHGDNAVSVFRRTAGGRLELMQEFFAGEGGLGNFEGGNGIAISPDGRAVYAAAVVSGSLACFHRDPASGELTHIGTLNDGDVPATLAGAEGIAFTPDGKLMFVSAETAETISIFRRQSWQQQIAQLLNRRLGVALAVAAFVVFLFFALVLSVRSLRARGERIGANRRGEPAG